jgi:hypothetical protein
VTDDPFREAPARPAALVKLAEAAKAAPVRRAALSQDALHAPAAQRRVALALGVPLHAYSLEARRGAALAMLAAAGGALYGAFGSGPYVFEILMASIAVVAIASMVLRTATPAAVHAEVARRLAADVALPFPVEGYDAWLASEIPILEVHLRGALDHDLAADAARGVHPGIAVSWIGERTLRLIVPALLFGGHLLAGDRVVWNRLASQMLVPIHTDVGIERVEMGGSMRTLRA